MTYLVDERKEHVMRVHIYNGSYLTLAWPRELTVKQLDHCKWIVNFMLDEFRDQAAKQTAGEIEYDSWPRPRAAIARADGGTNG